MTWIDAVLIAVVLSFLGAGLRMGSLYTASCLAGGFLGAVAVDYYRYPVSSMMGGFVGASALACLLLFAGTLTVTIGPGYLISRLTSIVFLGFLDKLCGVITGLVSGVVAVVLAFMLLLPFFPKMESSPAWKKSKLVRPLHARVENFFNDSQGKPASPLAALEKQTRKTAKKITKKLKKK